MAEQSAIQVTMRQHIIEQGTGQKFHKDSVAAGDVSPAGDMPCPSGPPVYAVAAIRTTNGCYGDFMYE